VKPSKSAVGDAGLLNCLRVYPDKMERECCHRSQTAIRALLYGDDWDHGDICGQFWCCSPLPVWVMQKDQREVLNFLTKFPEAKILVLLQDLPVMKINYMIRIPIGYISMMLYR
jgi:hypothetical protein